MTSLARLVVAVEMVAVLASSADASTFVIQPGFEGEDTAPYAFLPELSRGTRETLYAFEDPEGVHSFETFVRFELPEALTTSGEPVSQAFLAIFYGFDFTDFGDASAGPGTIECRDVLDPWTETEVTWSNRPAALE